MRGRVGWSRPRGLSPVLNGGPSPVLNGGEVAIFCRRPANAAAAPRARPPIDNQDAVEVVDFVLENARQESASPNHQIPAPRAPAVDLDLLRPAHRYDDAWNAEASLGSDLCAAPAPQPWIDDRQRAGARIRNQDARRHTHLGSGQADAAGAAHCDQHVGDQPSNGGVYARHQPPTAAEYRRIRIAEDNDAPPASPQRSKTGNAPAPCGEAPHHTPSHLLILWWSRAEYLAAGTPAFDQAREGERQERRGCDVGTTPCGWSTPMLRYSRRIEAASWASPDRNDHQAIPCLDRLEVWLVDWV
jgi:hypothetical protein